MEFTFIKLSIKDVIVRKKEVIILDKILPNNYVLKHKKIQAII